jgi:hypothetical protein
MSTNDKKTTIILELTEFEAECVLTAVCDAFYRALEESPNEKALLDVISALGDDAGVATLEGTL